MIVYVYRNAETSEIIISADGGGEGYAAYHETGLPYGDSYHEMVGVWDVPEAYATESGEIMIPYSGPHCRHDRYMDVRPEDIKTKTGWVRRYVPWTAVWPHKPAGSRKIEDD